MIYNNFTRYTPANALANAQYLQSDGRDWYEIRDSLDKESLKIAFQSDGIIRIQSYDATGIFPENLSVVLIDRADVPEGFKADGEWVFDGGVIKPREVTPEEIEAKASGMKSYLMQAASDMIAPLQDAVDLNMATDSEMLALTAWKTYRVQLNRINVSAAVHISWPKQPD